MLYINWFIRELTKLFSYPKYVVGNFEWGLDTMIPKARWKDALEGSLCCILKLY